MGISRTPNLQKLTLGHQTASSGNSPSPVPAQPQNPQTCHDELKTSLVDLAGDIRNLFARVDILNTRLETIHAARPNTSRYRHLHSYFLSEVSGLQNDAQTHFLHSVTLEMRMWSFMSHVPESPADMKLKWDLHEFSKTHKREVCALLQKMRDVQCLWAGISGKGIYGVEVLH
ncbi:hypothetical protein BGX38DRAFT_1223937 [Terfezia claveryi]|nr:hypothetical protein BGX38DRAFT_1223937 [Terfezia claveryi]